MTNREDEILQKIARIVELSNMRHGVNELDLEGTITDAEEILALAPPSQGERVETPSPQADVKGISADDWALANLHAVIETAANAADAAVYVAMRSDAFDPGIPDNVAEYVGNAVRAAFPKETDNV